MSMNDHRRDFLAFAIEKRVLSFGQFKTKAGRLSPYFFNAGGFDDGVALRRLGEFYANAVRDSGIAFDMVFGPAYKGIPLAAAICIAFAGLGRNVPFAFNRKEAKDHGEGGALIGAPVRGRVLIVDDVISAGTSVRESVDMITRAGGTPCGVAIALDRMERGTGSASAVAEVRNAYGLPVVAVATLDDLVDYLATVHGLEPSLAAVRDYRARYGVST